MKELQVAKRPLRIVGKVQNYAWGKVGAQSRIASFLDSFDPELPLAEYWLGVHPKASADVVVSDSQLVPLSKVVEGEAPLPFLLKILSIDQRHGLSIQTHPDAVSAKRLHARDPKNYPDESHKPEIGIALTPVLILYGFRTYPEIADTMNKFPEVAGIISDSGGAVELGDKSTSIQRLFTEIFRASPSTVADVVTALERRFLGVMECPPEVKILRRLRPQYGQSDVGLLAPFLMNIVTVPPGKGLFIGPNIPHAYLDGDLIECMACSDNVIRAGLTAKYKDVETLLATVSYDCVGAPSLITPESSDDGFAFFDLPVSEFKLGMVAHGTGRTRLIAPARHSIVLSLGKETRIANHESQESLVLKDGEAAFLWGNSGAYEIVRSDAALFIAIAGT